MKPFEGDFFISQICAGYTRIQIGDLALKIYPPTKEQWYESNYILMNVYNDAIESGCMDDDEIIKYLYTNGWEDINQEQLDTILPAHIEQWKIEIYNKFLLKDEIERIRQHLRIAEEEYNRLFALRHSMDHMTALGIATFARWEYLIDKTTKNMDGSDFSFIKHDINTILSAYYTAHLGDSIVREVAKSDKWKTIWSFSKKNGKLFSCDAIESTDEQRKLVAWSSLYDSVSEMQDCPPQDVIDDNDAFDGWLILKGREQKEERTKSSAESRFSGIHKDAGEIYIPVKSKEEASAVTSLNDATSKAIIESRLRTIKKEGVVTDDRKFTDVKLKNDIMKQQMASQAMKARK